MVDNMKKIIEYYYNLNITLIIYKNNKYYFEAENAKYIFKQINRELNISIIDKLHTYDFFMSIVPNNKNNLLTVVNDKKYVLLKINNNLNDDKISIYDIKKLPILKYGYSDINWIKLWENKVDNFEKWIFEREEQYLKIMPLFNYCIGLAETAILHLKQLDKTLYVNMNYAIVHERLNINTTLYEYYDPTTVIIDYISRDIAEYFKTEILCQKFNIEKFSEYLIDMKLDKAEINLLFARMLFPSFFFDEMENSMVNGQYEEVLKLESKIEIYQEQMRSINEVLIKKYGIENIKWL